jgi:hypothetical protein
MAPLVAAAVLFAAWWAETRVATIIAELKSIRENLDKLWADRSEEENVEIETSDREV